MKLFIYTVLAILATLLICNFDVVESITLAVCYIAAYCVLSRPAPRRLTSTTFTVTSTPFKAVFDDECDDECDDDDDEYYLSYDDGYERDEDDLTEDERYAYVEEAHERYAHEMLCPTCGFWKDDACKCFKHTTVPTTVPTTDLRGEYSMSSMCCDVYDDDDEYDGMFTDRPTGVNRMRHMRSYPACNWKKVGVWSKGDKTKQY